MHSPNVQRWAEKAGGLRSAPPGVMGFAETGEGGRRSVSPVSPGTMTAEGGGRREGGLPRSASNGVEGLDDLMRNIQSLDFGEV